MSERAKSQEVLDIVARTDASLPSFARSAGTLAHKTGLEQRGAVTRTKDGVLVVERRDGTVQVLKKVAAAKPARPGTVLKRRSAKGSTTVNG